MSSSDVPGKFHHNPRLSERFSDGDLLILSAALAQFIANGGIPVKKQAESAEVIRAREMMDCLDDEMYARLRVK